MSKKCKNYHVRFEVFKIESYLEESTKEDRTKEVSFYRGFCNLKHRVGGTYEMVNGASTQGAFVTTRIYTPYNATLFKLESIGYVIKINGISYKVIKYPIDEDGLKSEIRLDLSAIRTEYE